MHHIVIASVHENHKASELGWEKEKKDAASIIYVKHKMIMNLFKRRQLVV